MMVYKKEEFCLEMGQFLDMPCVIFNVSNRMTSRKSLDVREYTGNNLDVGVSIGNGKFKLIKEADLVKEYLEEGKGIYMEDKVYFLESLLESSDYLKKFRKALDKCNEKIEKKCVTLADKYLLGKVPLHQIPILNSIASLCESGFYSSEKTIKKMSFYLEESRIADYLDFRRQDKEIRNDTLNKIEVA
jgi:hypothetical protein